MDLHTTPPSLAFGEALSSTWEWGNPIDNAPQTNPDSWPRSEPAPELHSRAASSIGIKSPFQQSQHRKQFWRRVDHKKTVSLSPKDKNVKRHDLHLKIVFVCACATIIQLLNIQSPIICPSIQRLSHQIHLQTEALIAFETKLEHDRF